MIDPVQTALSDRFRGKKYEARIALARHTRRTLVVHQEASSAPEAVHGAPSYGRAQVRSRRQALPAALRLRGIARLPWRPWNDQKFVTSLRYFLCWHPVCYQLNDRGGWTGGKYEKGHAWKGYSELDAWYRAIRVDDRSDRVVALAATAGYASRTLTGQGLPSRTSGRAERLWHMPR